MAPAVLSTAVIVTAVCLSVCVSHRFTGRRIGKDRDECRAIDVIGPEFVPIPMRNLIDVDVLVRDIAAPNKVWTQVYRLAHPIDSGLRQVRYILNTTADGRKLTRNFSFRNAAGDCVLSAQDYDLVSDRNKAIYQRPDPTRNVVRQERYFSRCPTRYFWWFLCFDINDLDFDSGVCRGESRLNLFSNMDPPDQVPFEAAVKDLKQLGLSFSDSRFNLAFVGEPCPSS